MTCINCKKESTAPITDLFKEFKGWCMTCIHNEIEFEYRDYLQKREKSIEAKQLWKPS